MVFTAKSYDPFDQVKIRFWNQVMWKSELLCPIALKLFTSKITVHHFQDQSVLNNFASDYIEKRFTPGSVRYKMGSLETKITKHYLYRKQNQMMPMVTSRNISYNIENLNRYT